MVPIAKAVIDIGTVVVKFIHTVLAKHAVKGLRGLYYVTVEAKVL